jgi:hypothetical protein
MSKELDLRSAGNIAASPPKMPEWITDSDIIESTDIPISITWETAEYLACLIGQVPWGNEVRRSKAAKNLSEAMGKRKMSGSTDCFNDAGWIITSQKK